MGSPSHLKGKINFDFDLSRVAETFYSKKIFKISASKWCKKRSLEINKVKRIHPMSSYQPFLLNMLRIWSACGARDKLRGPPKSDRFIF